MTESLLQRQMGELLNRNSGVAMEQLLSLVSAELYTSLKTAVELGKWPNGARLQGEQLANCMQLVILYEHRHVPQQDRTGHGLDAPCRNKPERQQVLNRR
ncbi:MAG: DUF1315 family protein [Gammaproteobacteria bacterium]